VTGMSRQTGRAIGFDQHLAQSVGDILSTPRGSLVMRRDYGSDLPDLIDQPVNGATLIDVFQATAEALDLWEPRLRLERVQVAATAPGRVELDLTVIIDDEARQLGVSVGAAT